MVDNTLGPNLFKAHQADLVKSYCTYDSNSRLEFQYTAHIAAVTGTPCVVTQYTYSGTSNRVVKMKETETTWDSAYDI